MSRLFESSGRLRAHTLSANHMSFNQVQTPCRTFDRRTWQLGDVRHAIAWAESRGQTLGAMS